MHVHKGTIDNILLSLQLFCKQGSKLALVAKRADLQDILLSNLKSSLFRTM